MSWTEDLKPESNLYDCGEMCDMVKLGNRRGLHARAAAKFVRVADGFRAEITVEKDDMRVSGRSIMGLMMLAAAYGSCLKLCASGEDSAEALAALSNLVKNKFEEE